MSLTGSTVRAALAQVGAVGKQLASFDDLAAGADAVLRQAPAGLTAEGAAAFLATCAVESAWWRTTTEYGTGQRYAPFIGRTFVQLTWQSAYAGFGAWCHAKGLLEDPDVFVKAPASLSDVRWAWLGAVYYFESHGIWAWANAGNFLAVSQAVNGGNGKVGTAFTPNSWKERQEMYAVFHGVGPALLPVPASAPATATKAPARKDDAVARNLDTTYLPPDSTGVLHWRATGQCEAGSSAVGWACISAGCLYGGSLDGVVISFLDGAGKVTPVTAGSITNNHQAAWNVPTGTRMVTVEGTRSGPGVIASVAVFEHVP